jgi:hypothetical protein
MTESKQPKSHKTGSKNQPAKPMAKGHAELSEAALDKASGGSSWGMQDIHFCDGSVRTNVATPALLLPAVKPMPGN